jgi:hypothetical protein
VPLAAVAVTVPLQVLLTLGVAATTSFPVADGSVSLNATPVKSVAVLALLIVNVTVADPFSGMLVGLKALLMVGGAITVRVAVLLVVPVPPLVELTAPVVFEAEPACVPVTLTDTAQVLPALAMLPPDRLMLELDAAAVTVPLQVLLTLGAAATCNPVGRVSLTATPVRLTVLAEGLVIVNVRELVPLTAIEVGLKAAVIVGGATTVSVPLVAAEPVGPFVDVTVPVVVV